MKKKHNAEHENLERWLVSYADFITLLFAFFTVLYALSKTDKEKYEKAIESIQQAFLSSGGLFPIKGSPLTPIASPHGSNIEAVVTPKKNNGKNEKGYNLENQAKSQTLFLTRRSKSESQIKNLIQNLKDKHPSLIEVEPTDTGFKLRLSAYILFKPLSTKLRKENIAFLMELGNRLKEWNARVQVQGHSDNLGDNDTKWRLSMERAYTVVQFLEKGVSFPREHLSLSAFSDSSPMVSNNTQEGRQQNRRIEFVVDLPDSPDEILLK